MKRSAPSSATMDISPSSQSIRNNGGAKRARTASYSTSLLGTESRGGREAKSVYTKIKRQALKVFSFFAMPPVLPQNGLTGVTPSTSSSTSPRNPSHNPPMKQISSSSHKVTMNGQNGDPHQETPNGHGTLAMLENFDRQKTSPPTSPHDTSLDEPEPAPEAEVGTEEQPLILGDSDEEEEEQPDAGPSARTPYGHYALSSLYTNGTINSANSDSTPHLFASAYHGEVRPSRPSLPQRESTRRYGWDARVSDQGSTSGSSSTSSARRRRGTMSKDISRERHRRANRTKDEKVEDALRFIASAEALDKERASKAATRLLKEEVFRREKKRTPARIVGGNGTSDTKSKVVFKPSILASHRLRESIEIPGQNGKTSFEAYARLLQRTRKESQSGFWATKPQRTYDPKSQQDHSSDAKKRAKQPETDLSESLSNFKLDIAEREQRVRDELERLKPRIPKALSAEQEKLVQSALSNKLFKSPTCGAEQVEYRGIDRLRPGQWLDDTAISYYIGMVVKRSQEETKDNPKLWDCHYFNSFFYTKLTDLGYVGAKLKRWTKKVDIFSKDAVLIPINQSQMHWTAAVINFRDKRIEYYDSMGGPAGRVYQQLRTYLDLEHREKKGSPFDFTDWEDKLSKGPKQDNGSDCGVFTCQTLELVGRGLDPSIGGFEFSAQNMPFFRQLMIYEITQGKLAKRW